MNTIRPFFNKLLTILFVLILTLFVPCDIFRNFGSSLMLEAAELPYTQWHLPEGATARLGKGKLTTLFFRQMGRSSQSQPLSEFGFIARTMVKNLPCLLDTKKM